MVAVVIVGSIIVIIIATIIASIIVTIIASIIVTIIASIIVIIIVTIIASIIVTIIASIIVISIVTIIASIIVTIIASIIVTIIASIILTIIASIMVIIIVTIIVIIMVIVRSTHPKFRGQLVLLKPQNQAPGTRESREAHLRLFEASVPSAEHREKMPHEDLAQDHRRSIGFPLDVQFHEGRAAGIVLVHDHVGLLAHLQGEGLVVGATQDVLNRRVVLHITAGSLGEVLHDAVVHLLSFIALFL
eukprot:s148_g36.t1